MNARHSKRSLGFVTVAVIAALCAADAAAQIPTPNDAAAAGACLHLGGLVGCPNNPTTSLPLPPGSGSAFFTLQGGTQGTVWNIFGGGSTIFIPTTNFQPFVPPIPTPPVVTPIPTPPIIPPVTTPTTPPITPPVTTPTTPTTPGTPVIANPFTLDPLASLGGPARTPPVVRPEYSVREAFAELRIPIVQDSFITDLSLSEGARYSDYGLSAPGPYTYNIGSTWSPVRDIRFRGNYARAVRAPNLSDLFTPPSQNFNEPLPAEPPVSRLEVLPDRATLIHDVYTDFLDRPIDDQGVRIWIGSFDLPVNPGASADAAGMNASDYFATSLARGLDPNGIGFQGLPIEPIPLDGGVTFIPFVVIPDSVAFGGAFPGPQSTGPVAGDFNADGLVDAADYVVWRKNEGSAQDFQLWRDNFGIPGGADAGGGIFGGGGANPTLSGNTLGAPGPLQNEGGGVFNAAGPLTVGNSTLSSNTAGTPAGGGVRADKPLTVSGSTLSNNTAGGTPTSDGGGVRVDKPLTVSDSTLSNNTAGGVPTSQGGGVFNAGGPLTVSGSTLSNNTPGGGTGVSGNPQAAPADQNDERAAFIREQAQSIARRLVSGTPEERAQAHQNLDQLGNQELKDAVEQAKLELQSPQGSRTAKPKAKAKSKTAKGRAPILRSSSVRLRTAQIQTDASLSVIPSSGGFGR